MKLTYLKLSDLINDNQNIIPWLDAILNLTLPAKQEYPNYQNWFLNKHVPAIYEGSRETILALYNGKIVGVVNLKKDSIEKKICTIYLDKKYRRNQQGIYLIEQAREWLEEDHPLITISENKIGQFSKIIKKFDWDLTDCIDDYYKIGNRELIFNQHSEFLTALEKEEKIRDAYQKTKNRRILFLSKKPLRQFFVSIFLKKELIEINQKKIG